MVSLQCGLASGSGVARNVNRRRTRPLHFFLCFPLFFLYFFLFFSFLLSFRPFLYRSRPRTIEMQLEVEVWCIISLKYEI